MSTRGLKPSPYPHCGLAVRRQDAEPGPGRLVPIGDSLRGVEKRESAQGFEHRPHKRERDSRLFETRRDEDVVGAGFVDRVARRQAPGEQPPAEVGLAERPRPGHGGHVELVIERGPLKRPLKRQQVEPPTGLRSAPRRPRHGPAPALQIGATQRRGTRPGPSGVRVPRQPSCSR